MGFADCDDAGARCATDLGASSQNCGACGNACPEGLVCGAGVCRSPEDIIRVAAGEYYTCALRASGEVLCWGDNTYGQLGDGTLEGHLTPRPVVGLGDAVQIEGQGSSLNGDEAICARRASGKLACWGVGAWGQLGNGLDWDEQPVPCSAGVTCNPVPSEVVGVTEAASVATSLGYACALRRDGSVWCWGWNAYGQLGDGTTHDRLTAAPVVDPDHVLDHPVQLAVILISCVTLPTGRVACWGSHGWPGGSDEDVLMPTIAEDPSDVASVWLPAPLCVIHAGGALSCTGSNVFGKIDPDLPDDVTLNGKMIAIDGVTDATQVVSTGYTTCALRANGQVVCWGNNFYGALGTGSFDQPEEKIVTVSGLEGVEHLAGGTDHVCAALGSRGVACWGWNTHGQLGDGTTAPRPAPVPVVGLP